VNDVTRLQALVDKKKVVITEATIRDALRLNDVESIDCLPNEEIFTELSRMGTSWNEFSSFMASAVISLSTGILVAHQDEESAAEVNVDDVFAAGVADEGAADVNADTVLTAVDEPYIPSPTLPTQPSPPSQDIPFTSQGRMIADIDAGVDDTLKDVADIAKEVADDTEIEESADVQGWQAESQAQIYQIDLEHADKALSIAARRRKGVVIRDLEETVTPSTIINSESKSKDKGKGILDDVIDQVQRKEKEDNAVMRYQALKRKPQTEAQARKNMMIYLRNMAGFKMDYFKGMTYDDIRPIFEKKFNSNVAFLEKTREQMEEEDSRALKRTSKSQADKATKKQKLDEEVAELKRHLQIVPNDDDNDVYTKATPLALKIPVVDYEIYTENNKPYYKIIRADGSPQLFMSFLSLLRNFDREDLEMILLVEKRYPLTRFTLDQMFNNVRLEVEEESDVSLELLRFMRQQQQEGFRPE
nr:hypothetical protein [Tanacetum cinerariifolium]